MTTPKSLCAAALAMVIASSTAWAQNEIKQQPIELPAQGKTASFKGKINGYESVDYLFKAKPGQKLQIDLKTASTSAYFNLLQDGIDEALHIGSVAGSHFGGTLPSAGDYRIRVYLMRSAARKKASANYQVDLRVDR